MMRNIFFALLFIASTGSLYVWAQEEPEFTISEPFPLLEAFSKEAGIAINTQEPEILFTTIDNLLVDYDPTDPITGEESIEVLIGFFYNPETLEQTAGPFVIVGNPRGNLRRHSVTYNAFTNQYFVGVTAESYSPTGQRAPLMAIINPLSQTGVGSPVVKAWAFDEETAQDYDDTAVAVSSNNGNLLFIAEYTPPGESEGVVGILYDGEGNQLTDATRLDQLEPTRDEDDPDVFFLPENDVFLFITNIDPSTSNNRISATIIHPEPGPNGELQQGEQQVVSQLRKEFDAGHPAATENPNTGEFIGVLDYGNGAEGGDIFYFTIGDAPDYILTESRDQIPYFEASGGAPYAHRHPQIAYDPSSGVFAISHNATGEYQGMVFTLLGPDGAILPGRPNDQPYPLVETLAPVSNDANYHDIAYDPWSESFIIIYSEQPDTKVVRLTIDSDHRGGSSVSDWMLK
ncbi:MAG: hypothetical protein ACOX5R_06625 [bacterium]